MGAVKVVSVVRWPYIFLMLGQVTIHEFLGLGNSGQSHY